MSDEVQNVKIDLSDLSGSPMIEMSGQTILSDVADSSSAFTLDAYGCLWISIE